MSKKRVHIVCFDQPYPPNYGGSIDMYFKLKALVDLGAEVVLHVFLYDGKTASPDLDALCLKTYYYERRRFKNPFLGDREHLHHYFLEFFGYKLSIISILLISILPQLLNFFIDSKYVIAFFILFYLFIFSYLKKKLINKII